MVIQMQHKFQMNQQYIILNNEYYEDGNPYFNICYVICSAFGKSESNEDLFGQVFLNFRGNGLERENLINYVDKYDVADELNIDLVLDEEDEQEKINESVCN